MGVRLRFILVVRKLECKHGTRTQRPPATPPDASCLTRSNRGPTGRSDRKPHNPAATNGNGFSMVFVTGFDSADGRPSIRSMPRCLGTHIPSRHELVLLLGGVELLHFGLSIFFDVFRKTLLVADKAERRTWHCISATSSCQQTLLYWRPRIHW